MYEDKKWVGENMGLNRKRNKKKRRWGEKKKE